MNKLTLLSTVALSSGLLLAIACGSDDPATPGSSTSSTSSSTSSSSTSTSSSSTSSSSGGGITINCTTFIDKSPDGGAVDAGSLAVNWTLSGGDFNAAAPLCWKVKAGQSITFTPTGGGTFTIHPVQPVPAGQANNPFTHTATDATPKTFTLTTAGTYGFVCGNTAHQSVMRGQIQVVN